MLWCHGEPGSRLEPAYLQREAREADLRLIGIDRPGYGLSAPQPGRAIAGWVPEALAVAGHLGIGQFAAVGTSTGGAYALTLAALAPERVLGVVACCSMTDARWPQGRATMSWPHVRAVWEAPGRAAALAAATDAHGEDGGEMRGGTAAVLAPADLALFGDPGWMKEATAGFPAMFAHGPQGYTDDRLADGAGWVTFDVRSVQCPVTVLHGGSDRSGPRAIRSSAYSSCLRSRPSRGGSPDHGRLRRRFYRYQGLRHGPPGGLSDAGDRLQRSSVIKTPNRHTALGRLL